MTRIFVSYSRQDQLFARRLATDLVGLGAELWLDVDDIPVGMNWSSAIQQGLDMCEAMIVVISPYSMSSKNVEDEWQYYLDHAKPIVPVYLTTGRMHFQLSRLQYIDFRTAPYEMALKELHHELRRLGLKLGPFSTEKLSNGESFLDNKLIHAAPLKAAQPVKAGAGIAARLPLIILVIALLVGGIFVGARLVTNQPTPTVVPTAQPTIAAIVVTATPLPVTEAATQAVAASDTPAPTVAPTVAPTLAPTVTVLAAGATRTDKVGSTQVWVPAGCFTMGSDPKADTDYQPDETPAHQVCMTKGYWVDKYEVSNADYQKFIDAGGYLNQQYWSKDGLLWLHAVPPTDVLPINFIGFTDPQQPRVGVTWYEAEAYAKWREARLPTEAEWEYAARGTDSLRFAWGNNWDPSKPNVLGNVGKTSAVNGFSTDINWVGALNMTGNVKEWVADWYDNTYYRQQIKDDPPGPGHGVWRVIRGGAWTVATLDNATPLPNATRLQSRLAYRDNILPNRSLNTLGFRVVSNATP